MIAVKIKIKTWFRNPCNDMKCSLCGRKKTIMYRVTPIVFINSTNKSVIMCKMCVDKCDTVINSRYVL